MIFMNKLLLLCDKICIEIVEVVLIKKKKTILKSTVNSKN